MGSRGSDQYCETEARNTSQTEVFQNKGFLKLNND